MPTNVERNRFYQVHVCQGGNLPASVDVCTTKLQAEDVSMFRADGYRDLDSYEVSGNKKDGYLVEHRTRRYAAPWRITIEGPMTAQDMGYDSVDELCRVEGIDR